MNKNTLALGNARLVLPGEVISGSLLVRDGLFVSVDQGSGAGNGALDLEGDYLIPGLVDLHTDNLERQMNPRTTVLWPSPLAALLAHDAQVAAAGVTTVLDAVFVGEYHEGNLRRIMCAKSMEALDQAGGRDLLKAEHLLHLRCEFADPHVLELLEPHLDNPRFRLASLMDHTPGQRQFSTDKKFRDFYSSQNWSDAEFELVVADLKTSQARCAAEHRHRIVELCRERDIPLATHDDATVEQVDQSLAEGVGVCEFPTTIEAAAHAHFHGQKVVLGSPNVCLGRPTIFPDPT